MFCDIFFDSINVSINFYTFNGCNITISTSY